MISTKIQNRMVVFLVDNRLSFTPRQLLNVTLNSTGCSVRMIQFVWYRKISNGISVYFYTILAKITLINDNEKCWEVLSDSSPAGIKSSHSFKRKPPRLRKYSSR